eukprot:CCRYP_019244-RB/>CCRYP_019244-RB protein AED:0.11 eAED:0.11 QI:25/1/1/1/1/1/3/196/473
MSPRNHHKTLTQSSINQQGWTDYVDERRRADPGLSSTGDIQAQKLSHYLEPHLKNQASSPVCFIVSPMRRTIETILPTLVALNNHEDDDNSNNGSSGKSTDACHVIINGFYFESEGCHTREQVEPGMNAAQITALLSPANTNPTFVGFQSGIDKGWYAHGTGPETRAESEERAAKFYLWLVEFLDEQLYRAEEENAHDVFDAGVTLPEEESELDHDRLGVRTRRRRTTICVGHGDFMSLVLKRIVAGFGHAVEEEGVPHRSAFVHYNTGITELEYFGNGRFLIMSSNQVPHLSSPDDCKYITGGSLKDGWGYLMPSENLLDAEVSIAYADEIQPHVKEQTEAMRSLYLSKKIDSNVPLDDSIKTNVERDSSNEVTIVVKRGLQVVGCASLDEKTGVLHDVVVRPSARRSQVGESLIEAVMKHAKHSKDIDTLVVQANVGGKDLFEKMGFTAVNAGEENDDLYSSEIIRMECKL